MQKDDRSRDEQPCPECGGEVISIEFGQECKDCDWANVSFPEPPEGGWPRGSDMDRI